MSDFRAKIIADLDTTKIPGQLAKIEKQKITLSNFTLNTKGLAAKIQQALNGQQFTLNLTNVKIDNLSKTITGQMRNAGQQAGQQFSQALLNQINSKIATGGIDATVAQVQSKFEKLKQTIVSMGKGADQTALQNKLIGIGAELGHLKVLQDQFLKGGLAGTSLISQYNDFQNTLLRVKNGIAGATAETRQFASVIKVTTLQSQMETWLTKNSKATKVYGQAIQNYISQLKQMSVQGNVSASDLERIANGFKMIDNAASAAGLKGKTFLDSLKGALSSITRYVSASTLIYSTFNAIKKGVKDVIDLDTALVDLKKTTTATAEELQSFYYSSNETAKSLGVSTKEVIQAAADWSRLGYSIQDAKTMAETSSIFASISPGMDIESATDGLVSAMKAFDIEAEDALDGIASKINIIGNTQAVNNLDLVNILTRSSSAMKEANNTLEETIALGTAATEVTRDADGVGNALKTISMRIRGYDEETEEFTDDIEILEGKIANLTKTASRPGGISLFTDSSKSTYKSTYQLLKDISVIYDELTDKQQAGLLEALAGKRQGQVVAAILNNFGAVEKSLQTMSNSAGNAMAEMATIEESLEFKLNALKETAVGVFQNLFSQKDVSIMIELLTTVLKIFDSLTSSLGLFGTTIVGIEIAAFIKNFD